MKRKDMGDLKKDIADTASTSKEIVQDIYRDVKAEAQKTADTVDAFGQSVVTKTKNAADDIKKGAQDVGQNVKQTAVNISQSVSSSEPPHQTEKTSRKQSQACYCGAENVRQRKEQHGSSRVKKWSQL